MAYATKWVPLQVGTAMQILLNAAGSHSDRTHIGQNFYTSSIKAFTDDTTLVNRKQTVQRDWTK